MNVKKIFGFEIFGFYVLYCVLSCLVSCIDSCIFDAKSLQV